LDDPSVANVGAFPFSDELPAFVFVGAIVVCGFVKVDSVSPTASVIASPSVGFMLEGSLVSEFSTIFATQSASSYIIHVKSKSINIIPAFVLLAKSGFETAAEAGGRVNWLTCFFVEYAFQIIQYSPSNVKMRCC
jgi:hypothetical protein